MIELLLYFVFSAGIFIGCTWPQFGQLSKVRFSEVIKVLIFSFLWPFGVVTFFLILIDELGKVFKLWS